MGNKPLSKIDFSEPIKIYRADEVRRIRRDLRETRAVFAWRFFLTFEAVKGWEEGRSNLSGPALRLMLEVEREAAERRAEREEVFGKVLSRAFARS